MQYSLVLDRYWMPYGGKNASKLALSLMVAELRRVGVVLQEMMQRMDSKANISGNQLPHQLEAFDFGAMYANIPVNCLKMCCEELLELVYTYQEKHVGSKSRYVRYGAKNDGKKPKINHTHWSLNPPINANEHIKRTNEFNFGREKMCEWIDFVLDEGFVQFGGAVYEQSSGIFMGTAPAPDLANGFEFMHECNFVKEMISNYTNAKINGTVPLYPLEFIEQYGSSTKRFIDDIITVSSGSSISEGPIFEQIIKQDGGTYGGMYPVCVVGCEGEPIVNPISNTKEQTGQTVHFLDMEILRSKPGVSQIRMYDKRDYMPTLAEYRRYPHIETRLSKKCLYATLHCQLCRFAVRCSEFFFSR